MKNSNARNRRDQGETEFVECLHPDCRRTAHEDGPVAVCGKHIGEVYEYARDLVALATTTGTALEAAEEGAALLQKIGVAVGDAFWDRSDQGVIQVGVSIAGMRMAKATEWGVNLTPEDRQAIDTRAAEEFQERDTRVRGIVAADAPTAGELVYYMRFGDRVKIGYTTNLASRLKAVPNDELLATEPGTRAVESARHHQFRELRLIGEWFGNAEPLIGHIERLRRTAA